MPATEEARGHSTIVAGGQLSLVVTHCCALASSVAGKDQQIRLEAIMEKLDRYTALMAASDLVWHQAGCPKNLVPQRGRVGWLKRVLLHLQCWSWELCVN